MRQPTEHQRAVVEACRSGTPAEVAKRFGISDKRVSQIRAIVADYGEWKAKSDANERLPAEERLIQWLPISSKAVQNLTYAGYTTVGELAPLSYSE